MKWKAHLAMLSVALIYGANYTIAKNVLDQGYLTPMGFILMRVVAGSVLFFLIHTFFVKEKVDRKDIGLLAACGLFGIAVNQSFFFKGLGLTSPIHASLIMLTTPILVLIISSIYLKERFTWNKTLGVALGLIGASILILKGGGQSDKLSSVKGDLYIMINAASYGLYLVLVRKLMKRYHPFTVMKWIFAFGLIYLIPFTYNQFGDVQWDQFTQEIWIAVAYVLLFTTFLAYLLNAYALSMVSATVLSAYVYLQPLIASAISVIWYDDTLTMHSILCGLLIFLGVYLVSRPIVKA